MSGSHLLEAAGIHACNGAIPREAADAVMAELELRLTEATGGESS